jgi:hypothetical protein
MDSKYTIVQSSGIHNFYWVSIVQTILHSFTDDEDEFEAGEFE